MALSDIASIVTQASSLWSKVNTTVDEVQTQATYLLMDAIIKHSTFKAVYETVMLSTNAAQVIRNQKLAYTKTTTKIGDIPVGVTDLISGLGGALGLLDISLVTEAAAAYAIGKASPYLQDVYEKTLVEPNIEGVPISSSVLSTSRDIDIGEQMMIVQSTSQKKYWTDNAVPKLKEWQLEGYITPSLALDSLYLIKPSLKMQINFLDRCASSRRPVLFKDNRGEFIFVQITNLQTTEESSYNNAIKVNISLKEYKPFEVVNAIAQVHTATSNPDELVDSNILDLTK